MDRQTISKAVYNIGLKNRIGTAQNLYAGTNSIRAVVGAFTLRATIQAPCLLQTINISSSFPDEFTITDITIAGQSVMTSTQIALGAAFDPSAMPAGSYNRALGISVTNSMQIVVTGTTLAASDISLQVGLDPLKSSLVKSTAEQAYQYNFAHGMATVAVPPFAAGLPGTAVLTSISNRQTVLGEVVLGVLTAGVPSTDLYVTSFRIDSLEMLNSQTGAQEICINQFDRFATTIRDNTLGYSMLPQSRIDVTFANYNGGAATVGGVAFCEQWKP